LDFSYLTALTTALSGLKTVTEIPGAISNDKVRSELKGRMAELMDTVLNVRQQMLDLQQKYMEVLDENRRLKEAVAPKEKYTVKFGCYQFEGDDGMYCTACYDSKNKKIRASRVMGTGYAMCAKQRCIKENDDVQ
jgi:hypothetical protein